jgi:predicted acylesterase/phospholipase RssA
MALGAPDPLNLRRRLGRLNGMREALLPLPIVDRRASLATADLFPPFEPRPAPALAGKRVGVVASGGGAACIALVGVARAFEEAEIRPAAISACSASAVWATMWAGGLSAEEMADMSLRWRPEDHLGIQWIGLPRLAVSALRGFAGLAKRDALEPLLGRRLWHMTAGATEMTLHTVVYNLDHGRVEYFGTTETPELTLGEIACVALALPVRSDGVRVEGDLYVDGAVVDGFPAEPLAHDRELDHVFGLNVLLPPGLRGEEIPGWRSPRPESLELARRSRRRLGDKLTLIEPFDQSEMRTASFYDLFLDRGRWPRLVRMGYDAAVEALRPFRG